MCPAQFALYDWRLMELAVALSKYVGESDPLKLCCEFVSGYAQNGELTQQEIEVIPDAINLRIFSNCVSGRDRVCVCLRVCVCVCVCVCALGSSRGMMGYTGSCKGAPVLRGLV